MIRTVAVHASNHGGMISMVAVQVPCADESICLCKGLTIGRTPGVRLPAGAWSCSALGNQLEDWL